VLVVSRHLLLLKAALLYFKAYLLENSFISFRRSSSSDQTSGGPGTLLYQQKSLTFIIKVLVLTQVNG
jgi:hypothetical protein